MLSHYNLMLPYVKMQVERVSGVRVHISCEILVRSCCLLSGVVCSCFAVFRRLRFAVSTLWYWAAFCKHVDCPAQVLQQGSTSMGFSRTNICHSMSKNAPTRHPLPAEVNLDCVVLYDFTNRLALQYNTLSLLQKSCPLNVWSYTISLHGVWCTGSMLNSTASLGLG